MAGMKDEAGRAGEAVGGEDGWIAGYLHRLMAMTDEVMEALGGLEIKAGDVASIVRKARAIGVMARTAKAVEALRMRPVRKTATRTRDIANGDDADSDADTMEPAEREQIRAELESRLNRLRSHIEAKRDDPWPGRRGASGGLARDTEISSSPDACAA